MSCESVKVRVTETKLEIFPKQNKKFKMIRKLFKKY